MKTVFYFGKSVIYLSIIFMNSCKENNNIKIVTNGVSNYEIVYFGNSTENQYKYAEELQAYIHKISGVTLNITEDSFQTIDKHKIYIGSTDDKNLETHELLIKTDDTDVFISGGSDTAIRNAVYVFLEKYTGCKWYAPKVEEIPKSNSISINKHTQYSYIPDITTRTVHSKLFYNNLHFANKHKVTTEAFPSYVPNGRVHTFYKFIPEETYYKKHPEYFALRGSKRLPTQLCLTNPDVFRIVIDSVSSFFKKYPKSSVISVSQNDNQQYCQCKNCKKTDNEEGSHSGTMIRFVNKVATYFPNKTISTLAYQYTRKPPKTEPKKNVLITLCSIECDRSAAITEKCTGFADDIRGWSKITNNVRIWDYTTQFTNFLAPFPNIHTLEPNIKFFRDNDAKWVFEQHSHNTSELFELRSYITAKLLWNPDNNTDDLILEFTDGYYQKASKYIRQYIDLIHKKLRDDAKFFLFLYGDPSQAFSSYLNPELLKQYDTFFDKAEKSVINNPEVLQRVREARLGVDYAILEAGKKNISDEFKLVKTNAKGEKTPNPSVTKRLDNFLATCKKANITLMNEMGFTVNEYYINYKKAFEVATQPNKALNKKVVLHTKPKKYADEDPQVLTDGALGGNSFYANWLGFEGNNMEAVIDLKSIQAISSISTAFLQVSNHIVFFPKSVTYYYSNDNKTFKKIGEIKNDRPLAKKSKINDIKYFDLDFSKINAQYIKIVGENMNEAPYWHHAAGLPSWIFADEVIIN